MTRLLDKKEFNVLVDVNNLRETFEEIEKRIFDSLPELDLVQLNGMTPRFIKIDIKWQNGNKWNPYLDRKEDKK